MTKEGVVFNEDIIKAVTDSSEYTEDQVKHTLNFITDRIRKLASDPETLSIILPKIGTLYYKTGTLKATISKLENSPNLENQEELLEKYRSKLERMNDLIGHDNFSRHKSRSRLNKSVIKGYMTRKEMETNQNKKWI